MKDTDAANLIKLYAFQKKMLDLTRNLKVPASKSKSTIFIEEYNFQEENLKT